MSVGSRAGGFRVGCYNHANRSWVVYGVLFASSRDGNWHGRRRMVCCESFEMACHAVDADEDMFANFWRRRSSIVWRGFILALSLSLFAFGWVDVDSAMIA
jgi:hypothetical protein